MPLAMPHIKELLKSMRDKDWYITAFPFSFREKNYVVVFEDLRELGLGTQYYAVNLTFLDKDNPLHVLETYANSYSFQVNDIELRTFFGIKNSNGNFLWNLYHAFNLAVPPSFTAISKEYKNIVLKTISKRDNDEGFCCFAVRRNGKRKNGEEIFRSGKNTAKTKLLRPSLYDLLGNERKISFCYRAENELTDAEIIANSKDLFLNWDTKKSK